MDPSSMDGNPGAVLTGPERALLDALPAHAAILDRQGAIVAVNAAWQDFSDAHRGDLPPPLTDSSVGVNYLDTCRRCAGLGADQGLAAARGIASVLAGHANRFALEYACHGPGEQRWFVLEARPLGGGDGGCLVTHWDITERKADADALREGRDMYRALVDNSLDAVLLTSPDGRILAANPAACGMFGRTAEEMMRATRYELVDPTDGRLAAALEERARTGRFRGEIRYRRRDGTCFPGETASSVFVAANGEPRTSTVIRDIGRRRQADSALGESEARYRHLFHSMAQGAFLQRADGTLADINPAGLELLGLTRAEFLGRTSMHPEWRVIREDGSPWPPGEYPSTVALRTGEPVTGQVVGVFNPRRGGYVWMSVNAVPRLGGDGRPVEVHVTLHDITESLRAGHELAAVRERLELALAGGDLGTYDVDLRTGRSTVNARYLQMLGYGPGEVEFSVQEWLSLIHPEDLAIVSAEMEAAMGAERRNFAAEYRLRRQDGQWVWVLDRGRPAGMDGDGRPLRALGTLMDITSRKQAELELRASEARYRSLFDSSPDAIWVVTEGRIAMVNEEGFRMLGARSAADLIGRDAFDFIHPDSHALVRKRFARARTGHPNAVAGIRLLRLDGRAVDVEGTSAPVVQNGQFAVHVVIRDVSRRKEAEAKIAALRAELGQMLEWQAAGQTAQAIAHDINQPLNAITTFGEAARRMLADWDSPPPRLADALAGMTEQAARAGTVVRELLSSFRHPDGMPGVFDLRSVAEDAAALVAADAGREVAIAVGAGPAAIPVWVHRIQIEKALVNLLRNAVDATGSMPDGRRSIDVHLAVDGTMALLSVIDRGPGLSPENVKRLFQPFFTTKPGGIGMGLAIARSLVQANGGRLWHEPGAAGGAVFRFTLPLA